MKLTIALLALFAIAFAMDPLEDAYNLGLDVSANDYVEIYNSTGLHCGCKPKIDQYVIEAMPGHQSANVAVVGDYGSCDPAQKQPMRIFIKWGDGCSFTTDRLPHVAPFQSTHRYEEPGTYRIRVYYCSAVSATNLVPRCSVRTRSVDIAPANFGQ